MELSVCESIVDCFTIVIIIIYNKYSFIKIYLPLLFDIEKDKKNKEFIFVVEKYIEGPILHIYSENFC